MDHILIEDLEVFAHHGVLPEENKLGQKFLISMDIGMDLAPAGTTDDLHQTVDYGKLCHAVEKEFQRRQYQLIERAAEVLARFVLTFDARIETVTVTLRKPWAPVMRSLKSAGVTVTRSWHTAYLGIGSNLGDKEAQLREAIRRMEGEDLRVTKVSTLIETEPWGVTDQPPYMNGAVEIRTLLSPHSLITRLLEIEADMKRKRLTRWGPRNIDLDVLLYDQAVTSHQDIIVPHPRMHLRDFVLKPLNEIAPFVMHPVLNKRIFELAGVFETEGGNQDEHHHTEEV